MRALRGFERSGEPGPLLTLFDEECEAVVLGRTELARGPRELEAFWRDYRSGFRGVQTTFTHVVEGDSGAVLEWVAQGALASGEPVQLRGVTVLELEDGRIRRLRGYHDSAVRRD
jgi:ketosteroid isomerase-like protein